MQINKMEKHSDFLNFKLRQQQPRLMSRVLNAKLDVNKRSRIRDIYVKIYARNMKNAEPREICKTNDI